MAQRMLPVFLTSAVATAPLLALALWLPDAPQLRGLPARLFASLPAETADLQVALQAFRAPAGDWVLEIDVPGFQFTEICEEVLQQRPIGHAHVYVNGIKQGTAYQPVYGLGALEPGQYDITVSLRAQDHRVLAREDRSGTITARLRLSIADGS